MLKCLEDSVYLPLGPVALVGAFGDFFGNDDDEAKITG